MSKYTSLEFLEALTFVKRAELYKEAAGWGEFWKGVKEVAKNFDTKVVGNVMGHAANWASKINPKWGTFVQKYSRPLFWGGAAALTLSLIHI